MGCCGCTGGYTKCCKRVKTATPAGPNENGSMDSKSLCIVNLTATVALGLTLTGMILTSTRFKSIPVISQPLPAPEFSQITGPARILSAVDIRMFPMFVVAISGVVRMLSGCCCRRLYDPGVQQSFSWFRWLDIFCSGIVLIVQAALFAGVQQYTDLWFVVGVFIMSVYCAASFNWVNSLSSVRYKMKRHVFTDERKDEERGSTQLPMVAVTIAPKKKKKEEPKKETKEASPTEDDAEPAEVTITAEDEAIAATDEPATGSNEDGGDEDEDDDSKRGPATLASVKEPPPALSTPAEEDGSSIAREDRIVDVGKGLMTAANILNYIGISLALFLVNWLVIMDLNIRSFVSSSGARHTLWVDIIVFVIFGYHVAVGLFIGFGRASQANPDGYWKSEFWLIIVDTFVKITLAIIQFAATAIY